MKKFLTLFVIALFSMNTVSAGVDRLSQEYLQNTNHISITKHLAEIVAEKSIKKALKKETGAKFDVIFEGYTTSSIKRGIFKYLEITGDNVKIEEVHVPYINLKSLTDYNYIDYTKNPVEFKSDMTFAFDVHMSDETLNEALKDSDYSKVIAKVNRIASPLFVINGVRTKILDNRIYIITDYNFPVVKTSKDRSFVASSDFQVVNGKIKAKNVHIDSAYGNLGLDKVANLINYLNPLEFTLNLINEEKQNGIIENVNIVDNKVKVNGKIYVKAKK